MNAAIIYLGHTKYDNKRTLYVKIKKALKQLALDNKVTKEQQSVLSEMQRYNNFGWTIMNKRHTYTDGQTNHPSVFTDGLIIVVKKPFL